jgi:hypothetical protein
MPELKHVGRQINNKRRCIVAYRVVPNDSEYCLVVNSDSLDAEQHDSLMKLVESNSGQTAYELAEAMQRTRLPDGRNMLQTFHTQGKLVKSLTKDIEMMPNQQTTINLAELNELIAENRGVTVADLALGIKNQEEKKEMLKENPDAIEEPIADPASAYAEPEQTETAQTEDLLTDEKLAAQYRSQADAMYKEAKALRDQADELDPPATRKAPAKKPAAKKEKANG